MKVIYSSFHIVFGDGRLLNVQMVRIMCLNVTCKTELLLENTGQIKYKCRRVYFVLDISCLGLLEAFLKKISTRVWTVEHDLTFR